MYKLLLPTLVEFSPLYPLSSTVVEILQHATLLHVLAVLHIAADSDIHTAHLVPVNGASRCPIILPAIERKARPLPRPSTVVQADTLVSLKEMGTADCDGMDAYIGSLLASSNSSRWTTYGLGTDGGTISSARWTILPLIPALVPP